MGARIESQDLSISELFNRFYVVPDFQREYVWQEKHVVQLLDDCTDALLGEDNASDDNEYFIGSIVVCPRKGHDGIFDVIDGQQRLTTCFLILCVVRDLIREDLQEVPSWLQQLISYAVSDDQGLDVKRYRLELQYEDARSVLDKIAGTINGPVAGLESPTNSIKNILAAYATCRAYLEEKFKEDVNQIRKFCSLFIKKVKLIRVVTPDISMALKVFETINDRGVGLNAMDLLKNLLFMNVEENLQDSLKQRWKDLTDLLNGREKPLRFMKYFVMANYEPGYAKPIREDQLYEWISGSEVGKEIKVDPIGFMDLMLDNARAYTNFIAGNDPTGKSNRYLYNMRAANGQQRLHLILLLAGRHLGSADFDYLASRLENLIFCFNITRTRTNYLEHQVGAWAKQIRTALNRIDLEAGIVQAWSKEMSTRSENFDRGFLEMSTQNIQQYRLRYVLAKFAQYLNLLALNNKDDLKLDSFLDTANEIEHVLPDNPTESERAAFDRKEEYDEFKQRLGNLTLLERPINASIGNGAYSSKKEGYRHSQFILTKSIFEKPLFGSNHGIMRATEMLPQAENWTSSAIEDRQAGLAKLARLVWEMP